MTSVGPEKARSVLVDSIKEYCVSNAIDCPDLADDLVPLGGIPGLDSLHCVEVLVLLSERLHVTTDNNVFWDKSAKPRSVAAIVQHLTTLDSQ